MPDDTATLAAAVSDAATGAGNPAKVRVSRPLSVALWLAVGSSLIAGACLLVTVSVLAFMKTPLHPAFIPVWMGRLHWLGFIALGCVVVVGAQALSPMWTRVRVSGGPVGVELGGGQ